MRIGLRLLKSYNQEKDFGNPSDLYFLRDLKSVLYTKYPKYQEHLKYLGLLKTESGFTSHAHMKYNIMLYS